MQKWWENRVIYQIYPMSFYDSDGNGYGDLKGITEKLDYLCDLGVGAIWLSPVYASPMEDNGYDISDYCAVNPLFGTMTDMERLIREAHDRDLKVMMDLVINHTSSAHSWFRNSVMGIEPYKDFYIWRTPKDGKKPNNWNGFFGGDVWEYVPQRGQYYLHLFSKGQPDLNYDNPEVLEAVKCVLRFWLEKGIDGFRCDVINILFKESLDNGKPGLPCGIEHYRSTPGTHRILQELQDTVFSRYGAFTVGETVLVSPEEAPDFVEGARPELNQIFYFDHVYSNQIGIKWFRKRFSPAAFQKQIARWSKALTWNANFLENHDLPRCVSWIGEDGKNRSKAAKMLCMMLLSLRGTPYIYQGQEIGMTNYPFRIPEDIRDVEALNVLKLAEKIRIPKFYREEMIRKVSRDNARTPMQWNSGLNAGFSVGNPWINVNANHFRINIEDEQNDPESVLAFYKKMIRLRNGDPVLIQGDFDTLSIGDVFIYSRCYNGKEYRVLLNFTDREQKIGSVSDILISTDGVKADHVESLLPFEGIIARIK